MTTRYRLRFASRTLCWDFCRLNLVPTGWPEFDSRETTLQALVSTEDERLRLVLAASVYELVDIQPI